MSDIEIREELNDLDVVELRTVQLAVGRQALPSDFKLYWALQNERAQTLIEDERRGERVRRMARLLEVVTHSLATLVREPKPRYYPYTDVRILDWYMGTHLDAFVQQKERAARGVCLLLHDLIQFEADSLSGFEHNHALSRDPAVMKARIEAAKEAVLIVEALHKRVGGGMAVELPQIMHHKTLDGLAAEVHRSSALVRYSCMPQTCYHDEVVFLRTIHTAELCFYGIKFSLIESRENEALPRVVEAALDDAIDFAGLLHALFKILRTMPPKHFAEFRDATGDASAVQSRNFQLMEIFLRGFAASKENVFKKDRYLRPLLAYAHREFESLKDVLERNMDEEEGAWSGVFQRARLLDRKLLSWRGLHLMFAKTYLPPQGEGTGATEGAAYLERFLRMGLFAETSIDLQVIQELFEDVAEVSDLLQKVGPSGPIAPEMTAL